MSAVSDGVEANQRMTVMLHLLVSSPGFTERYMANRLLGSTPDEAALGALVGSPLAAEHVLATQGPTADLNIQRARRGLKALAASLGQMMEAHIDRMLSPAPTEH